MSKNVPDLSGIRTPGFAASHRRFCLVLLCSQPDTVHRFLLHRTQDPDPGKIRETGCII